MYRPTGPDVVEAAARDVATVLVGLAGLRRAVELAASAADIVVATWPSNVPDSDPSEQQVERARLGGRGAACRTAGAHTPDDSGDEPTA
jgi:hypothetical protein